jgi:hypothetical protein
MTIFVSRLQLPVVTMSLLHTSINILHTISHGWPLKTNCLSWSVANRLASRPAGMWRGASSWGRSPGYNQLLFSAFLQHVSHGHAYSRMIDDCPLSRPAALRLGITTPSSLIATSNLDG